MPGFYVSNEYKEGIVLNNFTDRCVGGEISYNNLYLRRNTLDKFMKDKLFCENDQYIVATEGVLLNKSELMEKYGQKDFMDMVAHMYEINETFFDEFIGPMSGVFYDKRKSKCVVWTNHAGDSSIFYYVNKEKYVIASQVNYIVDALKVYDVKLSFNEQAAYSMLTYAFMYDNITYANEIKRLEPGSYITVDKDGVRVDKYWKLKKDKYDLKNISDEELIEILDKTFRRVVKMEFDKDLEYGYRHLVDLSGGLDSRLINFVAKEMGYSNLLNLHYSNGNSDDEKIAKEVAAYLKNMILMYPLNDVNFLFDWHQIVSMNSGMSLYSGITGGKDMLSAIDCSKIGIEHTGQLGVFIGSYISDIRDLYKKKVMGVYSEKLLSKLDKSHVYNYDDTESQLMYIRGFNGMCSSFMIRRNYTEVFAPFINPELMDLCFSIPLEKRLGKYIYKKWIMSKYPEVAMFRMEATGCKLNRSDFVAYLSKIKTRGLDKLKSKLHISAEKSGMNPFDYWYDKDERIKKKFDEFFYAELNNSNYSDDLIRDMKELYEKGNTIEKTQVITVLAATKLYFG